MKKILIISFVAILSFFYFTPAQANWGDFTFRSTVVGDGVRNTGGYVYQINNEKYYFNSNEDVYALTRIFKISNIESFQFKQVIYSPNNNSYETLYSPVYRPYRSWWAETYSWVNFGKLTNGNYELKTYISVDGGYFKELSRKNFTVGGYYDNYNYNYRTYPKYTLDWQKIGLGINNTYDNSKEIAGEKTEFKTSETIYTLLKFSNIRDIYSFRIKQEVYNNSNNLIRTSESNTYSPHNSYWSKSFIENTIGTLPQGEYRIKTYIRTNSDPYRIIDEKRISVKDYYQDYNYNQDYNYSWTHSDNNLRHDSGYIYSVDNPKTTFLTNENVVVLTKLSNIKNINSLQIKHEFFKDGSSRYKTLESPTRYPNGAYWEYNYNYNNFGTIPEGNHKIKIFIRINDGAWRQLDEINIIVKTFGSTSTNYYNTNSNYNYDWTQTGDQISATRNPAYYYAYNNLY